MAASTPSPGEAAVVADQARSLAGCCWRDRHGRQLPIGVDQIMVVAPFNAQIRAIQQAVTAAGYDGLQVDTVERFAIVSDRTHCASAVGS
jgi:hypothetical protein